MGIHDERLETLVGSQRNGTEIDSTDRRRALGRFVRRERRRLATIISGVSHRTRKMALHPQFSLIHSEFNEFLFAPVGEEEHGPLDGTFGIDTARSRSVAGGRPAVRFAQGGGRSSARRDNCGAP